MNLILMNYTATFMIITGLIVRKFMIGKLPKYTFVAVWLLATARLLLPFTLPFGFNVWQPEVMASFTMHVDNELPEIEFPIYNDGAVSEEIPIISSIPDVSSSRLSTLETTFVLTVIWLVGSLSFFVYFITRHLFFLRQIRGSLPVNNPQTSRLLTKYQFLLKRQIQVRESEFITSPLTYGVFKPVILLPKNFNKLEDNPYRFVFLHELVHIKRFDTLIKIIALITVSLNWFNPFVWMMYVYLHRDLELSCDEQVIKILGGQERQNYALALIDLASQQRRLAGVHHQFSKHVGIKNRILLMRPLKKRRFVNTFGALIVFLIISSGMFVYGQAESSSPDLLTYVTSFEEMITKRNVSIIDHTILSSVGLPQMDHTLIETDATIEEAATVIANALYQIIDHEIDNTQFLMSFWHNVDGERQWQASIVSKDDLAHSIAFVVIDATSLEMVRLYINTPEHPFRG